MNILDSLMSGLRTLMNGLPQIIGGLVILIVFWIIAGILGGLIRRIADRVGLDRVTERAGINAFLTRAGWHDVSAGKILGTIAKWWIRVLAIAGAVNAFGIPQLSQAVQSIFDYIPTVFAAVLILLVGAFLAKIAGDLVRGFAAGSRLPAPRAIGTAAQAMILFLTFIAVLQQLNIAAGVAQDLLIAVLALVVGAGVLGFGLAFGLGGRDAAGRLIEQAYQRRLTAPSSSGDAAGGAGAQGEMPEPPPYQQRPRPTSGT
jgi:hypothetical protein